MTDEVDVETGMSNVRPIRVGARVRDLDMREGVVVSSALVAELPFFAFAAHCRTRVRYDDGGEEDIPEYADDEGPQLTVLA